LDGVKCDAYVAWGDTKTLFPFPVGHGQSEGERMVVSDFQVFVRDVLQHVDTIQKDYPDVPIFLLGHSMVSRPQRKVQSKPGPQEAT
jgi:hypothetical protein